MGSKLSDLGSMPAFYSMGGHRELWVGLSCGVREGWGRAHGGGLVCMGLAASI